MKSTEEAHVLTETIYKNLANKFNPQAKQVLANGKAYHKALLATSSAARAYIESLGRLGHEARANGKGGTEEIGQAIFRVAEAYKEIQIKFEDCTKALFAEIILPLEQKLDNEFKNAAAEQRKYHQGHKEFLAPYSKAANALEKFRKKNQSKGLYDEEKEAPYARAVFKYQEKLDEFRIQGLKLAMLEERKCYCFVLSHLAAVATVQLHYHDRGLDCLTDDLATWRQMSSQPHVLPRSADSFLKIIDANAGQMNGGMSLNYGYGSSHMSPYKQIPAQGDYHPGRPPSEYSLPAQSSPSQTLHRERTMLPPAPPQGPQVKAIYAHVPTHESQLKFQVGDTMTLIGDPADGWHYAYNPVTDGYGWLPMAYVESAPRTQPHLNGPPPRAKSISDLKEHSLTALQSTFTFDTSAAQTPNVPGTSRRPKSLHEPAMMKMMNDTFQPVGSETSSLHSASTVSSQISYPSHPRQQVETSVYQAVAGEGGEPHSMGHPVSTGGMIFSSHGQPVTSPASHQMFNPPSPPLPPPPVVTTSYGYPTGPPPQHGGSSTVPNTPLISGRPRSNSIGTYLPHVTQTPIFSIPPPPSVNAPLPPPPSFPAPQPPGGNKPIPPPVSQKTTSVTSMMSHSHANSHPPPPSHPPPAAPGPPPPPAPPLPKNEFSTRSLKKVKTNDRSAPRFN